MHKCLIYNINQTFFRRYGRSGEQARNYEDINQTYNKYFSSDMYKTLLSALNKLMSDNSELARLNSFKIENV